MIGGVVHTLINAYTRIRREQEQELTRKQQEDVYERDNSVTREPEITPSDIHRAQKEAVRKLDLATRVHQQAAKQLQKCRSRMDDIASLSTEEVVRHAQELGAAETRMTESETDLKRANISLEISRLRVKLLEL